MTALTREEELEECAACGHPRFEHGDTPRTRGTGKSNLGRCAACFRQYQEGLRRWDECCERFRKTLSSRAPRLAESEKFEDRREEIGKALGKLISGYGPLSLVNELLSELGYRRTSPEEAEQLGFEVNIVRSRHTGRVKSITIHSPERPR